MNTRGEESTDFCTGSRNPIERYTERMEWCPRTSGRAPPGRRSRSLERQVLLLRHAAAFLAARAVKKCWLRSAAGVPTRTHFTLTTTHTHTIDTVPPPPLSSHHTAFPFSSAQSMHRGRAQQPPRKPPPSPGRRTLGTPPELAHKTSRAQRPSHPPRRR